MSWIKEVESLLKKDIQKDTLEKFLKEFGIELEENVTVEDIIENITKEYQDYKATIWTTEAELRVKEIRNYPFIGIRVDVTVCGEPIKIYNMKPEHWEEVALELEGFRKEDIRLAKALAKVFIGELRVYRETEATRMLVVRTGYNYIVVGYHYDAYR